MAAPLPKSGQIAFFQSAEVSDIKTLLGEKLAEFRKIWQECAPSLEAFAVELAQKVSMDRQTRELQIQIPLLLRGRVTIESAVAQLRSKNGFELSDRALAYRAHGEMVYAVQNLPTLTQHLPA